MNVLDNGYIDEAQLICPSAVEYTSEKELKIEENYSRSFALSGYPSSVTTGWLDSLYTYDGDLDISIHIEPSDERTALDELTDKITQFEAQRMNEIEKGSIRNITRLESMITALVQQRKMLESNYENMFHVSTFANLYKKTLKELNKESQIITSHLAGNKIQMEPLFLRQEEGYMSTSPFGVNAIGDYARNMNTGAVSTMFPFTNPEETHSQGTFVGYNPERNTPLFIDFFNREKLGNANIFISGVPGSGKSYLVSLLTLRSILEGVKSVIIDPEGEYKRITEAVNGALIKMSPSSELVLNPFDIDVEVEVDDNGNPTGRTWVDIKGKVSELLNLFGTMLPNMMNEETKAILSEALIDLYHVFGFTNDPESLYEEKPIFDPKTGTYRHDHILRQMPRMSDYKALLEQKAQQERSGFIFSLCKALSLYTEGGLYDMFDRYTTVNINYESTPIITFDISGVEDDMLRPIAMQVALSWAWNKFVKKDLKKKKRIVCDEAWMMLKKTMAGSDYSSLFLEKCARRIRKYNGSLMVASQFFREFAAREEGMAIVSSSAVKIFMHQEAQDMGALTDRFILNDGEKQFVLSALRGETLLKMSQTSYLCNVFAFPFENQMITKEFLNKTA